jgi:hypothetical protein
MKARSIIILYAVIVLSLVWATSAVSQTAEALYLKSVYSAAIDEAIAHYKTKILYRNSRSEKLQLAAALACMKAAFFKDFKDELIEDMIAANIGTKPYKIQYHLNHKFHRVINPKYAKLRNPM